MPKIVDYPRAPLDRALELADAVDALGGEAALASVADRLELRPGGTFGALVATASKYGWVSVRRARIRTEPRYRAYRHAYDEAERRATLTAALRDVPLFRQLLDRFDGRAVPEDQLGRLLIREFGVPVSTAERVAAWFLEGASAAGLLAGDRLRATPAGSVGMPAGGAPDAPRFGAEAPVRPGPPAATGSSPSASPAPAHARYRVHVSGPDVESTVDVVDTADLDLVRALLAQVERRLRGR